MAAALLGETAAIFGRLKHIERERVKELGMEIHGESAKAASLGGRFLSGKAETQRKKGSVKELKAVLLGETVDSSG